MIGESSGVGSLLNNDRIFRENQVQAEPRSQEQSEETSARNNTDVTSFSPEALALSQRVVAAEGNVEKQPLESSDQNQQVPQDSTPRFLDIRV